MTLKNLFKKFCTGLITGLMKDLVGSMCQSSLNTIFQYQYLNISTFRPLIGSSYTKLPVELRSPKKRTNQHQKQ